MLCIRCHWQNDSKSLLICCAYRILTEIQLDERFGFLDAGEDIQGIMQTLVNTLIYAARVGIYPEFHPLLFYLNALLLPNMKGMVYTMKFVDNFVETRMRKPLP